jgi:phosphate/sulfate permease
MSPHTTKSRLAAALGTILATALGMGLPSSTSAAPVNGAVVGKAASAEALTQEVAWRRGGGRAGWWRPSPIVAGVAAADPYRYTGDYCRWPGWLPPWYGYCSYGHSYIYSR